LSSSASFLPALAALARAAITNPLTWYRSVP
jgi:hypothetical protein